MTTAGERLVFLAGGQSGTAGALLDSMAVGITASDLMVNRSTLGSNTAAVHLMYDTGDVEPPPPSSLRQAGFMANMGAFMTRV